MEEMRREFDDRLSKFEELTEKWGVESLLNRQFDLVLQERGKEAQELEDVRNELTRMKREAARLPT